MASIYVHSMDKKWFVIPFLTHSPRDVTCFLLIAWQHSVLQKIWLHFYIYYVWFTINFVFLYCRIFTMCVFCLCLSVCLIAYCLIGQLVLSHGKFVVVIFNFDTLNFFIMIFFIVNLFRFKLKIYLSQTNEWTIVMISHANFVYN